MKYNLDIEIIKEFIENDKFIISNHARMRMFQRNISTDLIKTALITGEVIEKYPDDQPCPSLLILGFFIKSPYHIVVAQCADHARIITVYKPEKEKWINYRKRRND